MKKYLSAAVTAAAVLAASPVISEGVRPVPVRGEIASVSPKVIEITGRDNETRSVFLAEGFEIVGVEERSLQDIKVGDFVSSTAVPDDHGGFMALQVSILPAALAGANEGQHPWDAAPDSVMTNAAISGVAQAGDAENTLVLSYDGGKEFEISVSEETPIVSFVPGTPELLKLGSEVFIIAIDKDAKLFSNRVIVETNGVKPPM